MADSATTELDALIATQEETLRGAADGLGLPYELRESLIRYAVRGVPTGAFLRAFLANDLTQAVGRADDFNVLRFRQLAHFINGFLGSECHGSYDAVDGWLASPMTREKVAAHG